MRKCLILITILLTSFSLIGCYEGKRDFIYDIFQVRKQGVYLDIVGLTEEGQEKEVVVFPSKIEGYENDVNIGSISVFKTSIKSGNLKVAVINDVNMICIAAFQEITNNSNNTIFVMNSLNVITFEEKFTGGNDFQIFVPFEVYNDYLEKKGAYQFYIDRYIQSRVSFYYNYDDSLNNGLYWTSYDNRNSMITQPEEPTRDGYEFIGWFTDSSGNTEFDFTDNNNITKDKLKLYAKWEETTI